VSDFDAADCIQATWWSGYCAGARDTSRVASTLDDPGEIGDWVDELVAETAGPVVHTFRGRPTWVTR